MQHVFFVHIPRTAGTSIERTARRILHPKVTVQKLGIRLWSVRQLEATPYDEDVVFTSCSQCSPVCMLEYGVVPRLWLDAAWKFAIVRNPWDRLLSLYGWLCWHMEATGKLFTVRRNDIIWHTLPSFADFTRVACSGNISPVGPFPSVGLNMANPQVDWLRYDDGTFFTDYIGRFEKLEEAWHVICDNLGVSDHPELQHRNVSEHKPYREYYTPELRSLVAKWFAEDIDTFQYAW